MHIHILGICGTFMGGLAALAREAGHRVTGCDAGVYPPMSDQLRALGIELIEGYGADQMALAPDVFVIGNVVSRIRLADGMPKFPLMEAILDAGARYTSGPQWLAQEVLQGRHVLAVAGTHGKTTTTSMLAWILERAGRSPGFLVGGVPLDFGVSARLGGGSGGTSAPAGATFVIEADEYDTAFFDKRSKFVHYRPRTAILNNLEFDHADIFDDLAAIERQFHHLVRTVPASGRVVVNATEESLQRVLAQGCWSEVARFGAGGEWQAQGTHDAFDVLRHGEKVGRVEWALSGLHNQMNALAAIAAAEHVGVTPAEAAAALGGFRNVRRRMEVRGTIDRPGGPITVYDDFAHHPTAIRTTLEGLRNKLDGGGHRGERILAAFEPRSNTMKLGTMTAQLPWSLEQADLAFCHSGGLEWDAAAALAPMGARARVAAAIEPLVAQIAAAAQPGDHIVCMSNGGFGGVHQKLISALRAAK
ncbi:MULTISPECIES: UDP-N-acetylmuramate:L-alanyl-gamma-D-glutamyl-meso-diaminopimelate ligase [unclassified Variovorax]|uniref:UDP-N-acetylmuramate:L-alanyl-gamma-D-glutamyl- meso-diaminopimelate ligase n=1 Tax=unclassified Variovorax TaxID=663243 RepID=UPI00076BEA68|nr:MULTISPECIES: UDP-N-acetylmuramate:L-alanyl-gamma-D-glutamyl-meso-diaminopimelate ligase [unclassified Variovorax]KWT74959.1 UDP-N-acetylmuramate:L-alanyl-gamma-D-glutamyl- meso-diaminopimelate ligase [Variovorax sp. WDL1]PNG59794.1 UDP-N-acetylmuramate--L-alanyl-gamma-D-glutamyl-meso-2,6-diaminoheptandioate ligase [Variovorax sp. B4]PNG60415.1 UDP-N-acetylmuramate--L-alanyl-gamma-D-glutamyl-meso-2,6-diaminoheptandioate ligase [Variovorax sp. B2]VTV13720.1 UDP-N-acetylmuramate:L-alanyl-gamma